MLKEYDESHSEANNRSDLCLTLNIKKIIEDDTTILSHLLDLYAVLSNEDKLMNIPIKCRRTCYTSDKHFHL